MVGKSSIIIKKRKFKYNSKNDFLFFFKRKHFFKKNLAAYVDGDGDNKYLKKKQNKFFGHRRWRLGTHAFGTRATRSGHFGLGGWDPCAQVLNGWVPTA